jgi:hypothetical protein
MPGLGSQRHVRSAFLAARRPQTRRRGTDLADTELPQQLQELGFVDHGDAERSGFLEL